MESDVFPIAYPQTLIQIWRNLHGELDDSFSDEMCGEAFETLRKMLAGHFCKKHLPGINDYQDACDAANDCLLQIMSEVLPPESMESPDFLIAAAKKFLARRNNPVQYEMDEILREALLTLEKEGKIVRDEASKGHRISTHTWFAFPDTPVSQKASRDDYERNRHIVHSYSTKIRANSAEDTRMLSPSNAKMLTVELLQAFSGWTAKRDLLYAMQNHIPEQMKVVRLEENPDGPQGDPIENLASDNDDDFIYDFDRQQAGMLVVQTARRIWERICKVSDTVFCLYFLPKHLTDAKVDMKKYGKTSTVSDQNSKITRIVEEEMQDFKDYNEVSSREYIAIMATVREIFQKLHGKCTECGKNPDLSVCEAGL